jgi:three-Cys-motif partner protein
MRQPFGGRWTAEKLAKVRAYLEAYVTALKNQPFERYYIDAFAGTGYCGKESQLQPNEVLATELAEKNTQAFLKGSARIALEVEPGFDKYVFIDRDPNNCAELDRLKYEFPGRSGKITVLNEDANICLKRLLDGEWRNRRAVLFLDPYGMQVEWNTVRAIAATQAVDMWYLFPLTAVNRMLPRDADISPAWKAKLTMLFGDEDWEKAFYEQRTEPTLFGPEEITEKTATFDAIEQYLLARLATEFAGVAHNPWLLRDEVGRPLFLLCFAAANPRGKAVALRIAEHILGK